MLAITYIKLRCKCRKKCFAFNSEYSMSTQRDKEAGYGERSQTLIYLSEREYFAITAKGRLRKLFAAARRRKRSGYGNGADHYRGTPALHRETSGGRVKDDSPIRWKVSNVHVNK